MDVVFVEVMQSKIVYDKFIIRRNSVIKFRKRLPEVDGYGDVIQKPSKRRVKLCVDGILLHYFAQELKIAPTYRNIFMDEFHANTNSNINAMKLYLLSPRREIIDYSWNERTTYLVRERCELEHTLSWLSTLGGAFSALGDYFLNFAEVAGKISLNQLQLAFRLGDPNVISRCRLYLSLSLIQQNQFQLARKIIYSIYISTINSTVVDKRLVNMCKGIWCKLIYEHQIYKKLKHS